MEQLVGVTTTSTEQRRGSSESDAPSPGEDNTKEHTMKRESTGASRRRSMATISLVAVVSLLATACASSDGGGDDSDGPLKMYASLGVSGASSAIAKPLKAGMEAAIGEVNEKGGLLGREMELEVENNESDPTKAVSKLQKRLNGSGADVVWAGSTSSETLAMLSMTTREKVIALNNGSAPEIGDAKEFPYSFSAGVGNEAQANFLTKILQDKGYKTIGVLTATGAFGEALNSQYEKTFKAAGMTVVSETYEPDAVEMDGPLGRIGDKNPDVVVFNDFLHPTYVLKSRVKAGLDDVPFIGDISTTLSDISGTVSAAEKQGVELASYTVQTSEATRPAVETLKSRLDKNGTEVASGLYLYALAYDTVLAYANAVEAAGSVDVDKVRDAMVGNEGDSFELTLTDDIGWTEDVHIGSGADSEIFTMIPVSPMVDGQFQLK